MNPVFELSLGVCLVLVALYFVLRPILNPLTVTTADTDAAFGQEGEEPGEDLSPRAVALRALKEIEFDRATGKLSESDYDALKGQYTSQALAALREEGKTPSEVVKKAAAPSRAQVSSACPVHGARPETDAQFCSECGRRLELKGTGFCSRCGSPLEREAQFCSSCGRAVAA